MKNRFGDRFAILCGVDTLALESTLMGADGSVCAFSTETVAINNLVNAGRIQETIEIYRWFLPLLELDINPKLVLNIKQAEVYTKNRCRKRSHTSITIIWRRAKTRY